MSTANTNGLDGLAEGPEGDQPMSFWDHLSELRNRLVKGALGVVIGCIVCFVYATELREFLAHPLHEAWLAAGLPGKPELQVLAMMDAVLGTASSNATSPKNAPGPRVAMTAPSFTTSASPVRTTANS